MKILIVCTYFPPRTSIASLRPYSWAKWWSREGHDVTVLTTPKRARPWDTPMPFVGFRVQEVPVPLLSRYVLHRMKLSAKTPKNSETVQGDSYFACFMNRIRQKYGIFSACRFPEPADLWAVVAARWARQQPWDLVVSTGGPYSVHRIGLAVKRRRPGTKWVVDWRDLWVDNHIYPGLPFLNFYEKVLERKFHRAADMITTVSEPLAEVLRTKTGKKVQVIFNGFDPEDYTHLSKEPFFPKDGILRIVYTGTVYRGKQDPSPLFEAIHNLRRDKGLTPDKLRVVFVGSSANAQDLAKAYGVEDFCEYLGLIPRNDALRTQRDADALLFLEFEAPGVEGILTGKLFEYLYANKFILAVGVSTKTSTGNLIVSTTHGAAVGKDVTKIQSILEEWITVGAPSVHRGSTVDVMRFSRHIQAKKMLECILKESG